jgi:subtilase family serine protease
MSNGKRRVRLGALVILFFLAGINFPGLIPSDNARVLAESITAPDLMVESISWSPELPVIGNTVVFTVAVRNQGDSPAGISRLAYFIDDNIITSTWIAGINPGATILKTFTWKAQAGSHIIKAVIDYENSVAEIDENNNDKTFAFSVLAPDLVVASITWLPVNPSIGDKVTFSVTVKNQGNKTAAGSNVNLSIDGNTRGYREIHWLEAGENTTATFTWPAISGSHTLEVSADRLNQVKESDETNNNVAVTYTTAAPDLVIDSITWSPQNRSDSSNVTMTVKISNRGGGKAEASWLAYYIDDSLQTEDFINEIKAGASITKKYSWIVGADSHTFKAVADYSNKVRENDETNNARSVILPAIIPDLIIQSITCSPVQPIIAHQIKISVVVKNIGLGTSGDSDLDIYLNDALIMRPRVPKLASGKTAILTCTWVAQTDAMTLKAVVDVNNLIKETNESNNTKTVNIGPLKSSPDTDLTIESMAWTPAKPLTGDIVTITVSIKNKGPGQAGVSYVDYYIDDTFLDSVYVDQIGAGKTIVNSVIWQAIPGKHTIKAIADCDNRVAETSETNNEKTVTLVISAPDLIIQGVTWSPVIPLIGDEVIFTVMVKNQGDQIAGSSYINYYIDDSFRGSHSIEPIEPGATVTRTFTWRTETESPVLRVVIDEANNIKESSESNNEKTIVLPAPDLTIDGITWSPENPSENATVTFNIMVKNQGAGQASSPQVTVYINDTFLASIQFNQLNAGETATGACTWTALSGNYTLNVVADEADIIVESNEKNNENTVIFSINQELSKDTTQEITPSATPESILPETVTANNTEIIKALLFEDVSDNQDIAADIADTSPAAQPWWQKILMNRLLIIGVGVLGVGAVVVLMLLKKKARKK